MGIFARRDSPPKHPHSTLNDVLPPAFPHKPLWAQATDPTGRRPGPRAPRETYAAAGAAQGSRTPTVRLDTVERAGRTSGQEGEKTVEEEMGRLRLEGTPQTPLVQQQHSEHAPYSAPGPAPTAEHVYPPFPPLSSPSSSSPRWPPPLPTPPRRPSPSRSAYPASLRPGHGRSSPSHSGLNPSPPRPPLPTPPSLPVRPIPPPLPSPFQHPNSPPYAPSSGGTKMPSPTHYYFSSSTSSPTRPPALTSFPSPVASEHTYPAPPSPCPPRSPGNARLARGSSPVRWNVQPVALPSAPPALPPKPPLPPPPPKGVQVSPPKPVLAHRPMTEPIVPSSSAPRKTRKARGRDKGEKEEKGERGRRAGRKGKLPVVLSLLTSSEEEDNGDDSFSLSSSSPSSALVEGDDDLPPTSTRFCTPSPGKARLAGKGGGGKGRGGSKARCVSAPVLPYSSSRLLGTPSPSPSPVSASKQRRRSPVKLASVRQVQCAGITASSSRCTRMVTVSSVPPRRSPSAGDEQEEGEDGSGEEGAEEHYTYCGQHAKLALVESGMYLRTAGGKEEWVEYADWIPSTLPLGTQATLRGLMSRPVSEKDKKGFIYLHQLLPRRSPDSSSSPPPFPSPVSPAPSRPPTTLLKLGRALHPVARLSQWRASCPSVEILVRGVFPLPKSSSTSSSSGSLPPTQAGVRLTIAEDGTPNHHRWERLCLVELAGREEQCLSSLPRGGSSKKRREKCGDCGRVHQECFVLPRGAVSSAGWRGEDGMKEGEEEQEEWTAREVVMRWERWCRGVPGEGQ
ncbi:hypothetical protein JCM8547_003706 [Rhodosporidiobolus lusitaniae]